MFLIMSSENNFFDEKIKNINFHLDKLFLSFENGIPEKNIFSRKEYAFIYTDCYNICINQTDENNNTKKLYQNYSNKLNTYLSNVYMQIKSKNNYLLDLTNEWNKFQLINKWLHLFFQYLNRHFIKRHYYLPIKDNGYKQFYDYIFIKTIDDCLGELFNNINKIRVDSQNNISHITEYIKLLDFFNDFDNLYYKQFNIKFLDNSKDYYKKISISKFSELDVKSYLATCIQLINFEKSNIFHLRNNTLITLEKILYQTLLYEFTNEILNDNTSGIKQLLINNDKDNLKQIYELFKNSKNSIKIINNILESHVNNLFDSSLNNNKNLKNNYFEFINDVINIYNKITIIIRDCFNNYIDFHCTLANTIRKLFNNKYDDNPYCLYLVLFINNLINKNKLNDNEKYSSIETSIKIFKIINDKDIFIELYQKYLSNRLLLKKNIDLDIEKYTITQIKIECGTTSTSKIEKMIKDFMTINESNIQFQNYCLENNIKLKHNFEARVLTNGSWPTFKNESLIIPIEVYNSMNIFSEYYLNKNSSHKLTWYHQMDDILLSGIFNNIKYSINCNVYQSLILLLFNDSESLNYETILVKTGIDKNIFNRVLHSLTCSKYKLLLKSNNDNNISNTEVFSINNNFKDKLKRIKLQCPSLEIKLKKENTQINRSMLIDSTIVRIMKSRKKIDHNQLVSEVISQIRLFLPSISDMKKRIESLIEREYIERESQNVYKYLA